MVCHDIVILVARYDVLAKKMKSTWPKLVKKWSFSIMNRGMELLSEDLAELKDIDSTLTILIDKAKTRIADNTNEARRKATNAAAARRVLIGEFKQQGDTTFPLPLLQHVYNKGLFLNATCVDAPAIMVAEYEEAGHDLPPCSPWLLNHNTAGTGADTSQLVSAIGEKRVQTAMKNATDTLSGRPQDVLCETALVPRGGGHDTIEALAWLPREWKTKGFTPESMWSLSAPWLITGTSFGIRSRPDQWPVSGFGHLIRLMQGDMLACIFLERRWLKEVARCHVE